VKFSPVNSTIATSPPPFNCRIQHSLVDVVVVAVVVIVVIIKRNKITWC